jgi:hypothetical protein
MRTVITFSTGQKVTFRGHTLKQVVEGLKEIEQDPKTKNIGYPVKLIRKPV